MAVLNLDNSKYARKSWTLTEQGNKLLRAKRYTLAFIGHNISDDKITNFIKQLDFKGEYEKYDNVITFLNTNHGNPLNKTYIIFQIIADLENELSFSISSLDAINLQVRFHFLSHTSEFLDNALALQQILYTINLCQQGLTGQVYNIDEFLHTHSPINTTMAEEYTDTEIDDFDPSNIKFIFITNRIPNDEESKIIHLKLLDIGFDSELLYYQSPLDIDFAKHEHNKLAIINTVNDNKAVALDITEPQIADKLILYMHLNGLDRLLHDCSDVYMWISEVIDNFVTNIEEDPNNNNLTSLQQVFIDTSLSNLYNNVTFSAKVTSGKGTSDNNSLVDASTDSSNSSTSNSAKVSNASLNTNSIPTDPNSMGTENNTASNSANTNTYSNNNQYQQTTSNQANSQTNSTSNSKTRSNNNRNLSPVVAFVGVNPNKVAPQLVNDMVSFILGHSNNNYQFFRDYNDLYSSINSNPNLLFNIINCSPINYDFVKVVNFGFMLQLSNFEQVNYDNARVIASLRLLIDLVKSGSYHNIINLT